MNLKLHLTHNHGIQSKGVYLAGVVCGGLKTNK